MILISANLSKKVPLPNVGYSSQQYGASIEIEVGDADSPESIHGKMRKLYALLNRTVDEQISSATAGPAQPDGNGASAQAKPSNGGNGTNRVARATAAQCKAIFAICKSRGLDMQAALADFHVADPAELSVRDASRLIDALKSKGQ
jgi:hypothetical protein